MPKDEPLLLPEDPELLPEDPLPELPPVEPEEPLELELGSLELPVLLPEEVPLG